MIILDVNNVSKNFGFGELFKDVSFVLNEGESISVVGPNGCGKSTLLKMIAGLESLDSGAVNIKRGAKVAYLDQTGSSIDDDRMVYEILRDAFAELNEMEARLNKLQEDLTKELPQDEYEVTLQRFCNLQERFIDAGGYDIDVNVNTVIEGLNINKELLFTSYNDLSGGEKTLIQLAKALLIHPDLFLLDEPTNHLDIDRIEWLENYIKSFKGATVIVSHDRYFLDRMSSKILALDNGSGKVYSTNYSGYVAEREREFEVMLDLYGDQQKAMKRLEEQIKYFAQLGMAKNSSTLTYRAHVLQNRLDRMRENAIERPKEQKQIRMGFDENRKSSKVVIETRDLRVDIPGVKPILKGVDTLIKSGERVALLGANGSGKSTYLKTIMGTQDLPVSGYAQVGPSVQIGYLPQIISFPKDDQELLEYFRNAIGVNEQRARQILAGFQFYKDDVCKRVKNLSGGERIRVKLAELLQQKINTLIFDEPTNHIDIPTKEVLEDAIENFDGTLIFVSHDRYFINKFADRIIEFEDGLVTEYLGGYDDYKRKKKFLIERDNRNQRNGNKKKSESSEEQQPNK